MSNDTSSFFFCFRRAFLLFSQAFRTFSPFSCAQTCQGIFPWHRIPSLAWQAFCTDARSFRLSLPLLLGARNPDSFFSLWSTTADTCSFFFSFSFFFCTPLRSVFHIFSPANWFEWDVFCDFSFFCCWVLISRTVIGRFVLPPKYT